MHICFSSLCIVLFPLRTPASWRSAKCTRMLFKVWRKWPNSKSICYSERGEPRLSFEYKFVGHPWKVFTLYCIVSTETKSWIYEVHTDFKVWRNWPNSKLICYSERGEPRLSFENKRPPLYTQPYMHVCFSSRCIVLFPLRPPASWRSANCTRRLFKVWRNWPNSKSMMLFWKGRT